MLVNEIENNNSNKIAVTKLSIMILLTVITQAVMLIKTSVTASQFGANVEMDAYNLTNSIGTFIFSFIGAGVTTILIPNLVNKGKDKSINVFISALYSVAFIMLIIIYIFRRSIIYTFSTGNEYLINVASNVMLITLITQFCLSISGITNAVFQVKNKFNIPKVITLATSILLVLLIYISPKLDIYKFSFFIFITTLISILIQIIYVVRSGYRYSFSLAINDSSFKSMIINFVPTVLSTGLYQISLLTGTLIASKLGAGQISVLTYSNTIISLINTLLLVNIITYFYPKLVQFINSEASQEKLFDFVIFLNGIMSLVVVGFFIIGKDFIKLLYERGNFDSSITSIVYICTIIYIVGLPINAVRDLIYRYFYAKEDTLTPFNNSLIISVLNIIISILLSKIMGIYGVILGSTITSFISLAMIMHRFKKKFSIKYDKKVLVIENLKILITSVFIIVGINILINIMNLRNSILTTILYGIVVVIAYVIMLIILKSRIFKIKL